MKITVLSFLIILIFISTGLARIGGGDIKYEVKHMGNVIFHHDTHVKTMGFPCTECHQFIFETKKKNASLKTTHHRKQAKSCAVCHNGKQAFDLSINCDGCHQKEVK